MLFKQLFLSGNIAAVALCKNVLAHSLDGFARNDLSADTRLDRHLKELSGDLLLELFRHFSGSAVRLFLVDDERQRVNDLAVEHDVELDKFAGNILL